MNKLTKARAAGLIVNLIEQAQTSMKEPVFQIYQKDQMRVFPNQIILVDQEGQQFLVEVTKCRVPRLQRVGLTEETNRLCAHTPEVRPGKRTCLKCGHDVDHPFHKT